MGKCGHFNRKKISEMPLACFSGKKSSSNVSRVTKKTHGGRNYCGALLILAKMSQISLVA
jgi:hypothetical protein